MDQLTRAIKDNLVYKEKVEKLNLRYNELMREYKKTLGMPSAGATSMTDLQKKHLEISLASCHNNRERYAILKDFMKDFDD